MFKKMQPISVDGEILDIIGTALVMLEDDAKNGDHSVPDLFVRLLEQPRWVGPVVNSLTNWLWHCGEKTVEEMAAVRNATRALYEQYDLGAITGDVDYLLFQVEDALDSEIGAIFDEGDRDEAIYLARKYGFDDAQYRDAYGLPHDYMRFE